MHKTHKLSWWNVLIMYMYYLKTESVHLSLLKTLCPVQKTFGRGRVLSGGRPDDFGGINAVAGAFLSFVAQWLTSGVGGAVGGRWSCPWTCRCPRRRLGSRRKRTAKSKVSKTFCTAAFAGRALTGRHFWKGISGRIQVCVFYFYCFC